MPSVSPRVDRGGPAFLAPLQGAPDWHTLLVRRRSGGSRSPSLAPPPATLSRPSGARCDVLDTGVRFPRPSRVRYVNANPRLTNHDFTPHDSTPSVHSVPSVVVLPENAPSVRSHPLPPCIQPRPSSISAKGFDRSASLVRCVCKDATILSGKPSLEAPTRPDMRHEFDSRRGRPLPGRLGL